MPSSYASGWSNPLLNALVRATNTTISSHQVSAVSGLRYKTWSSPGTEFSAAANGEIAPVTLPVSMNHANTGTVTTGGCNTNAVAITTTMTINTTAPCEVETSNLSNGVVISSSSSPAASTVTRYKLGFAKGRGTVSINTALRNMLCELIVGRRTAHISANGTVKVYSGAPPDVDSAATGTLMWQTTFTSTTWNAASSDAATLAASLVATSEAFGSNLTCGYARIAWNLSGTDYVIQGLVGQATSDFQFTSLVSGTDMAQSTSYTLSNATLAFT